MWTDAWLAYFHFLALIGTVSLLVTQAVVCRPGIGGEALLRLQRVDMAYAMFAGLALASGVLRLLWGSKGSSFYLSNPVFHAKLGLFVLVGLLSIAPTVKFIAWSKAARQDAGHVPPAAAVRSVRRFMLAELAAVAAIPLMATLMARGIGIG
jgi:putative membrane protein